ncbi:MAG: FtsX-like permease family protein [Lachnospiraceae bacterium]|nr:FtsX-like permease family protein [Lachnospiraceae bacterium]
MKKIRQTLEISYIDRECRRKESSLLIVLICVTLFIFLMVNSMIKSIECGILDVVYQPYGNMYYIIVNHQNETRWDEWKSEIEQIEGVKQVFYHIMIVEGCWEESDIVGTDSTMINMMTKIDSLDHYIVDGTGELNKGEIIVPKYIYNLGEYNEYTYLDGKELIGRKINIGFVSEYDENIIREYTFVVKGTYDNIKTMCSGDMFCVNEEDARVIYDTVKCQGQETYIHEILSEYGIDNETEYEQMLQPQYMGISISLGYDREEVKAEIEKTVEEEPMDFMTMDENLVQYFDFIIFVGNIIATMLAIATVIVFIVSIRDDIRKRKKEFALRSALGYQTGLQVMAYIMEKFIICVKGWFFAYLAAGGIIWLANTIIQKILPFYERNIQIKMTGISIFVPVIILISVFFICIIVSIPEIYRIRIIEILKREGIDDELDY